VTTACIMSCIVAGPFVFTAGLLIGRRIERGVWIGTSRRMLLDIGRWTR
jgi:hypothetical protein